MGVLLWFINQQTFHWYNELVDGVYKLTNISRGQPHWPILYGSVFFLLAVFLVIGHDPQTTSDGRSIPGWIIMTSLFSRTLEWWFRYKESSPNDPTWSQHIIYCNGNCYSDIGWRNDYCHSAGLSPIYVAKIFPWNSPCCWLFPIHFIYYIIIHIFFPMDPNTVWEGT